MKKEARGFPDNPKYVAEQIRDIVDVIIGRMSIESKNKAYPNIRSRVYKLPVADISSKKNPGGAAIGVSIGLIKNILNGRDQVFIRMVINELMKVL
jgi:hypothetical protein